MPRGDIEARGLPCFVLASGLKVPVAVLPNNSAYRVGDLFFHLGDPKLKQRNIRDRTTIRNSLPFNHSVMRCYLEMAARARRECDPKLLRQCCTERQPVISARALAHDNVALHFRSGDKGSQGLKHFNRMAHDIAALNTSGTIHVVTSLNFSPNVAKGMFLYTTKLHKESCAATGELVRRLEGLGYRVTIQSSEDVDKDLCYLLHSRRVVASTGGFGLLSVCSATRSASCATPYRRTYACREWLNISGEHIYRGHASVPIPVTTGSWADARRKSRAYQGCREGLRSLCILTENSSAGHESRHDLARVSRWTTAKFQSKA